MGGWYCMYMELEKLDGIECYKVSQSNAEILPILAVTEGVRGITSKRGDGREKLNFKSLKR